MVPKFGMLGARDFGPYIARVASDRTPNQNAAVPRLKKKLDAFLETGGETGVNGDQLLANIETALDELGVDRSVSQKQFHVEFINSSLPHIYGTADFEACRDRVLKRRNLVNLEQQLLVCTPRRWGKTYSVAMFCAVMLYYCPKMWISIFSTGQRASTSLLELCNEFFLAMPGGKSRVKKKNDEQFFVRSEGGGDADVRRLYSFPSSVSGLKGQGGKIIILEEASRLDYQVFSEVIIPLLGVRDTTLIGISTPLDSSNFYSQLLLATKPNGEKVFKSLTITLVCEACRSKGLVECAHSAALPAWKTQERSDLIKQLMSADQEKMLRENCGVVTNSTKNAFDFELIARLGQSCRAVNSSTHPINSSPLHVLLDPCGGGGSSLAVVAGYVNEAEKTLVILGCDASVVKNDEEQETFLRRFFTLIREDPEFSATQILVGIERNYGGGPLASRIANIIGGFKPIAFWSSDAGAKKTVGFITTAENKARARADLSRLLRLDSIRLCTPFKSGTEHIQDELIKQLQAFRYVVKEPTRDQQHKKARVEMSGKSFGQSDDLALVTMLLAFWPTWVESQGSDCWL